MLLRVSTRSSCRAGSVAPSGQLSRVDMVTDVAGLEVDTKLIWCGQGGVHNSKSRAAWVLERRT
jgi:hypothetical protein